MIYRLMSFETSIFRICGFPPHKPSSQHLQFHRETLAKVCKSCRKKTNNCHQGLRFRNPCAFHPVVHFLGYIHIESFLSTCIFLGYTPLLILFFLQLINLISFLTGLLQGFRGLRSGGIQRLPVFLPRRPGC